MGTEVVNMEEVSFHKAPVVFEGDPHRKAAEFVCSLLNLTSQGVRVDWSWPDAVHVSLSTSGLGTREVLLLAQAVGQAGADECEIEGTVLRLWWD